MIEIQLDYNRLIDTWMHPDCHKKIRQQAFHKFLLHARRGEILAVHLRSKRHDFTIRIRI